MIDDSLDHNRVDEFDDFLIFYYRDSVFDYFCSFYLILYF